jgi:predicted molibdopterin-dependent oxidoreductase YjgC
MSSENVIVIDGQEFSYVPGETILQVARRNHVDIPTLCYLKGASPTGVCRICLVEVEGVKDPVASCAEVIVPGMVVRTDTQKVMKERKMNLELLLGSGDHNCLVQEMEVDSWTDFQLKTMETAEHKHRCPAYGDCRLQDLAIRYQVKTGHYIPEETVYPIEAQNPFIVRDFSRCVLCGRCVQACNEVQVNEVINFGYHGPLSKIVTRDDVALKDSDCVFCGECVQACPVGALVPKHDFDMQVSVNDAVRVRTTCTYCGVGCQIFLHVKDNRIVKVTGVEDVAPNYGSLCVKGRFGYDFIHDSERLKTPLIKENGTFREASWDEALDFIADRLTGIKENSGPDSIMVLTSARVTTEENYLAQKFARAVIGTNNIDHCARL